MAALQVFENDLVAHRDEGLACAVHLPPVLRGQIPGSHLFEQAGAYPGFPVFLLTNRVGKTSGRPRNSVRNSFTLSAGLIRAVAAADGCRRGGGKDRADAVANSARSDSRRAWASSRERSSSASRCSCRAIS